VATLAGANSSGTNDGNATPNAKFNSPYAAAMDPITGVVWIADTGNNRLRRLASGTVSTSIIGSGSWSSGAFATANISGPSNLVFDGSGAFYLSGTNAVARVDPTAQTLTVVVSSATAGLVDGSTTDPATRVQDVGGLVLDPATGRLYFSQGSGTSPNFGSIRMIATP
jgi:hypothetical protein